MNIKPKQYAQSLYEMVKDADKNESKKIIEKFVCLLVENNQTSQVEKILDYFTEMWNKEKGIVVAEISSARKLDANIVKMLKKHITDLSDAELLELSEKIDEDLLGGIILKYNNKIVDNSLRTRVQEFKKALIK